MAKTEVFLGPPDLFSNPHVLFPFHPRADMGKALANIAATFDELRMARRYRPCVGGIVYRYSKRGLQVLMGVTASSALRLGVIQKRGERVAREERTSIEGHYTFPKGGAEEGDGTDGASVLETAYRELFEEMGLRKKDLRALGVLESVTGIEAREHEKAAFLTRSGFSEGKAHAHVVLLLREGVRVKPRVKEIVGIRWVRADRFLHSVAHNRPETARVLSAAYHSALLALEEMPKKRFRARK